MEKTFEEIYSINVNEKTEKKNGLTYLSWAWAWAEFKKAYPDATYTIKTFDNNLPYVYDEKTGYMVFTEVCVGNLWHEMWLPVMDANNKAMKKESYTYTTKNGERQVEAATMTDINKAIMRCLTKNLAMFGLGLYIYAGEDLPETPKEQLDEVLVNELKELGGTLDIVAKIYKIEVDALTNAHIKGAIEAKKNSLKKAQEAGNE